MTSSLVVDGQRWNVCYQSPEVTDAPGEAPLLLLGHRHFLYARPEEDAAFRSRFAALLDRLVTPGSVLVAEGLPSLFSATTQDPEFEKELLEEQLGALPRTKACVVNVVGWDNLKCMLPCLALESQLKKTSALAQQLFRTLFPGVNPPQEMDVTERLFQFGKVDSALISPDFWLPSTLSPTQIQQGCVAVAAAYTYTASLMAEEGKKTMTPRTDALIKTITKLWEAKQSGLIRGKIILFAGTKHLDKRPGKSEGDPESNPFCSHVDRLYEALRSIPSQILSIPV